MNKGNFSVLFCDFYSLDFQFIQEENENVKIFFQIRFNFLICKLVKWLVVEASLFQIITDS